MRFPVRIARLLPGLVAGALVLLFSESAHARPGSGETFPALESLDEFFSSFVDERQIVGATLAVSYHGRLVYARGVGYANREIERPVEPGTRFRIASLSKPITAVAVLKLVEAGQLQLSDRAFDVIGLPPYDPSGLNQTNYPDPRVGEITVQQLLRHRGGWDRKASFDPLFKTYWIGRQLGRKRPAGKEDIIRFMLSRPLESAPGKKYIYSNFGYLVLGRVIERRGGRSYEEFVQREVLRPLGIRGMRIGHGPESKLGPDETRYYSMEGPSPKAYKHRLQTHDANGGWVGSAVELVRFLSAFDAKSSPRILRKDLRQKMLQGLRAGGIALSHRGSFSDCCSSVMTHRADWSYAAFFNVYKDNSGEKPTAGFDQKIARVVEQIKAWPRHDLFERYL